MLQLNTDQERFLAELAYRRALRRIALALAGAFGDVAARAADRFDAVVEHGATHAAQFGLRDAACVARYLACCFVWGMEFERQERHGWAAQILGAPGRGQAAKAYQLCVRTAEELDAPAVPAGLPSRADFQAALQQLDAQLLALGELGALVPTPRLRLGMACDLEQFEIALRDADWRQHYTVQDGRWQRVPSVIAQTAVRCSAQQPQPWPQQLTVLSRAPGHGAPAQLRLRVLAAQHCEAGHPLLRVRQPGGTQQWRGGPRLDVNLPLYAPADDAQASAGATPIAGEATPELSLLELHSCGLRDSGAPLREVAVRLAAYDATQWLLAWRRDKPEPFALSAREAAPEPSAPPPRARLERAGEELDASRWRDGLSALDAQFSGGLRRLFMAWERESGVTDARLAASAELLVGASSVAWGWLEGRQGIAEPPCMRVQTLSDLVACALELQLDGQLQLDGAVCALQLRAQGRTPLQGQLLRDDAAQDLAEALKPAQVTFSYGFTLQLAMQADAALTQLRTAGAVQGAIRGACGLRPRRGGPGLEWFAQIDVEPVAVALLAQHPLRGQRSHRHALLPAMRLLDWSLG